MASSQSIKRGNQIKDMAGTGPWGFLRVLEYHGTTKHKEAQWRCFCDKSIGGCGRETIVTGISLRSGNTKSCGCRISAVSRSAHTKHGEHGTPEYRSWAAMLTRCNNANSKNFAEYGARGIRVCERWSQFENFLADMGRKPSLKHTIDRRNNDGNYEPDNCVWATRQQQSENKRNTRRITINGRTQCVAAWCRERGLHVQTVRARLKRGWPAERALSP